MQAILSRVLIAIQALPALSKSSQLGEVRLPLHGPMENGERIELSWRAGDYESEPITAKLVIHGMWEGEDELLNKVFNALQEAGLRVVPHTRNGLHFEVKDQVKEVQA
jgi:hypothetical protein